MQNKICPDCHREFPSRAKFCVKCGVPLTELKTPEPIEDKSEDASAPPAFPPSYKEPVLLPDNQKDKEKIQDLKVDESSTSPLQQKPHEPDKKKFSQKPEPPITQEETGSDTLSQSGVVASSDQGTKLAFKIASRLIPPFGSFILTLIFLKIVSSGYGLLYRLFWPSGEGYQRLVPWVITYLLFWTLLDLLIKLITTFIGRRNLDNVRMLGLPKILRDKGLGHVMSRLEDVSASIIKGKSFQRIHALLRQLDFTRDAQRSHEFFRHESEIDSDNAGAGYSVSKIFIWAMPILGFIGTVIGIGLAVGEFSGFLTGDIDNVELVKRELSRVASGLSFAFDTTLLGLTASLIAMLVCSFVQRFEEGFLTGVEDLGLKIIREFKAELPAGTPGTKPQAPVSGTPPIDLKDEIKSLTATLAGILSEFTKRINNNIGGLSQYIKDLSDNIRNSLSIQTDDKIVKSMDLFKTEMERLSKDIHNTIMEFTEGFVNTSKEINVSFAQIPVKIEQEAGNIKKVVDQIEKQGANLHSTLDLSSKQLKDAATMLTSHVEKIKITQETGDGIETALNTFSLAVQELRKSQDGLAPLMKQFMTPFVLKMEPRSMDGYESDEPPIKSL